MLLYRAPHSLQSFLHLVTPYQIRLPDRKPSQSCLVGLNHRYEFTDADDELLSDRALPNGTTMSPDARVSIESGEAGDLDELCEAADGDWMGANERNLDCCWLEVEVVEAMVCGGWLGE